MIFVPTLKFMDGKCREAMEFYSKCFMGSLSIKTFSEVDPEKKLSAVDANKVMHAELLVGDNSIYASDFLAQFDPSVASGKSLTSPSNCESHFFNQNKVEISINCKSVDEVNSIYAKLSVDSTVVLPLADVFWNARYGILKDKFGIVWMLIFQY